MAVLSLRASLGRWVVEPHRPEFKFLLPQKEDKFTCPWDLRQVNLAYLFDSWFPQICKIILTSLSSSCALNEKAFCKVLSMLVRSLNVHFLSVRRVKGRSHS